MLPSAYTIPPLYPRIFGQTHDQPGVGGIAPCLSSNALRLNYRGGYDGRNKLSISRLDFDFGWSAGLS